MMPLRTKQKLTTLNFTSKTLSLQKFTESSSLFLICYHKDNLFHLPHFTSWSQPKQYHTVTYLKEMPLTSCLCLQALDEREEEAGERLSGAIRLLMISLSCALWKIKNGR